MDFLLPAIVSASTSVLVVILAHILTTRREERTKEKIERDRLKREYLNPLRLYLVENHFRLSEIMKRVKEGSGKAEALLFIDDPKEISNKGAEWFNGEGCYLISSCYLTACLFHQLQKVRDDLPYIRLGNEDDTKLLTLMLKVNLGFLRQLGIFYATQPSIGIDMYLEDKGRIVSYREFCEYLMNPDKRVWFDRLISYFIETGRGEKLSRVEEAIGSIQKLTEFLDKTVAGGTSIQQRLEAEGIKSI